MRDLSKDLVERMSVLDAELERLKAGRDAIDNELRSVERKVEALRIVMEFEPDMSHSTPVRKAPIREVSNNRRWAGVPITHAIDELIQENSGWGLLERDELKRKLYRALRADGYDFGTSNWKLVVNMGLTRVLAAKEKINMT